MIERSPIEPSISHEGPIIACIGEKKDFLEQSSFLRSWKYDENNRNVDYYATSAELNRAAMQNSGELTYVISPIDGQNKFSNGLRKKEHYTTRFYASLGLGEYLKSRKLF